MNEKYRNFKLDSSHIGHYIVCQMKSSTQYRFDSSTPFGLRMTGIKGDPVLWVVCQIDWYNKELFKNNEYKSYLHPVGKFEPFFTDRPWYNCDIESRLHFGDAEYFENLEDAMNYADEKNTELISNS